MNEACGARREDQHTIPQKKGFLNIVCHKQSCRTLRSDDIEQICLHDLARHSIDSGKRLIA